MNALLHFTTRWLLWPLVCLGIVVGIQTSAQAQTCPSGWTSVAAGTTYPVSVSGSVYQGNLYNIAYGGADGVTVFLVPGNGNTIITQFNQMLSAGGKLEVVAAALGGAYAGDFSVAFSQDGVTYSAATTVLVPATVTTLTAYTVAVPSNFQYAKITGLNRTYVDIVSYKGSFCQGPNNYSDCSSGQNLAWRVIEPQAASGSVGGVSALMHGPDASSVQLTQDNQFVITRFDKAFAVGDTIQITGIHPASLGTAGDFTILTSLDGVNFTALQSTFFGDDWQTILMSATQAFQYVKLVKVKDGNISIDAITVLGKTCVTTPAACTSGGTAVSNGLIYPINATGSAYWGNLNNIIYGGVDAVTVYLFSYANTVTAQFNQTLAAGGSLQVVAGAYGGAYAGNFSVSFSNDGLNFSTPLTLNLAGTETGLRPFNIIVPSDFQYVKIVGLANTLVDAVYYKGDFCQKPVVTGYASCSSGQSQTYQLIAPVSVAGASSTTALYGPDGVTTHFQAPTNASAASTANNPYSITTQFAKPLAIGDTILLSGFKSTAVSAGEFMLLTSMDGINFTTLATDAFSNVFPTQQIIKIIATKPFQYVKIVASTIANSSIDLDFLAVNGKTCLTTPSGNCTFSYQSFKPVSASGILQVTSPNDLLTINNTGAIISAGYSVTVDFGQSFTGGGIYVLAKGYNGAAGSFKIQVSNDNVNFTQVGVTANAVSGAVFQTEQFNTSSTFRYIKITAVSISTVDYISVGSSICTICSVTASAELTQPTCNSSTGSPNDDGKLSLNSFGGGATKVGYSTGGVYTGPGYSAAVTLGTAPVVITNTLSNPIYDQPYTIRVFKDASCYKDTTVILKPKVCSTSDLSLTISPSTQTGSQGDNQTYTVTVTNSGPDPAPGVKVRVPIPKGRTFMLAQPQQGTYAADTQLWDVGTMAVGSKTMTLTIRID